MLNNSLTSITVLFFESQFEKLVSKNYFLRLYGTFRTALTPFKLANDVLFPTIFDLNCLCISDRSGRNIFSSGQHLPIILLLNNETFFKIDFGSNQKCLIRFKPLSPELMILMDTLGTPNRRVIIHVSSLEHMKRLSSDF